MKPGAAGPARESGLAEGKRPPRPPRGRLLRRLLREALRAPGATGPLNARRLVALALFLPPFLVLQAVHWLGFLLDDLLFPGYRDVEVTEPLFVVGLPRSGTSFVQRVLAADERFTTLRLWELLLAPSVTERKAWLSLIAVDRAVGRPFGRLVGAIERLAFRWMDEVHPVSLSAPEEDYFLLLPAFACVLLVVPFPYHSAVWRLTRFDGLPREEREPLLAFYRSCLQRHLYVVGADKRLLSKNPSFTPMVRSLTERFPDSRVACCVRDPREAVPSLLSSLEDGARLFGWDPGEREVRDRFVAMMEGYARHALDVLDGPGADRSTFLPLGELRRDVKGRILAMYEAFGWEPSPGFREHLERMSERARSHTSGHSYTLEEFDLSADELKRRFAGLNSRFGFDT